MSEASVKAEAPVTVEVETELRETLIADPVLLAARDQARAALSEITESHTIGAALDHEVQGEHVLTLFFECLLPGYPGWKWAATLARVDEKSDVNVLEVEMLPGNDAVIAPEWVPWSERLTQYRETQASLSAEETALAEAAAAELDEDDDLDSEEDILDSDLLDNDFSDFDDDIHGADASELLGTGFEDEGGAFASPEPQELETDENSLP